ncbi:hypothetical protein [Faecousia sp.]|uniref:hypothetical protein n=1 Tax=Faecousia sp. TaxID=2952921 RepID=UPI003AB7E52F
MNAWGIVLASVALLEVGMLFLQWLRIRKKDRIIRILTGYIYIREGGKPNPDLLKAVAAIRELKERPKWKNG